MRCGELPDYATRGHRNATAAVNSSLPMLALFSPTRELYRVEPARKWRPASVERQSLERKASLLRNVLDCVTRTVGNHPFVSLVFGALSVAVYSASASVIAKMVTAKDGTAPPPVTDATVSKQDEETPPPSRPPSPPPASDPSSSDSAWSIVIEELHDEPKSGVQRGRAPRRRSRSSSWSRNFMNSLRRKKTSRSEERFSSGSNTVATKPRDEAEVAERTSDPNKSVSQVELAEKKAKPLRALSLGSFRRRKPNPPDAAVESADQIDSSVPVEPVIVEAAAQDVDPIVESEEPTTENPAAIVEQPKTDAEVDTRKPSKLLGSFRRGKRSASSDSAKLNEEIVLAAPLRGNREVDSAQVVEVGEVKPKSRMLSFASFRRRKPDRSVSLDQPINEEPKQSKDKTKSKKDKPKKSDSKTELTDEKSKAKTKDRQKAKEVKPSKASHRIPEEIIGENAEAVQPESVAKRNAFVSFFRREKKEPHASEVSHEPEPLKKGNSRLRNSFGRRMMKTKSVDSDGQSSTVKVPRSASLFGSAFSLKRVFHPAETAKPAEASHAGILTKRGSSSGQRPKSVHLDESPQFMELEEKGQSKTAAAAFGFNFKPKKLVKAKSLDESKIVETSGDDTETRQVPTDRNKDPAVTDAIPCDPVPEPSTNSAKPHFNVRATRSDPDRAAIDQSIDEAFLHELVKSGPAESEKVPDVRLTPIKPAIDLPLKQTVADVLVQLRSSPSSIEGNHLKEIFHNPLFQVLVDTHDTVAADYQDRLPNEALPIETSVPGEQFIEWDMPADMNAVRIVGLRRNPGEPLGLTVKTEDGQLVIARILGGGAVDRQGLLHAGDIIGEVNGVPVYTAEQLQVEIARSKEHVQLKILPSSHESIAHGAQVGIAPSTILAAETINSASACCVRAHFDYEPKDDKLLPCPEIGLAFKKGDILQVVNQSDPNWWQAKKVGWSGPAGLIPSQELEERRKAFVAPEADFVHKIGFCGARISKKKKKLMYQIKSSVELDKAELLLYEEVTRMPPFRRKTLVLVGSEGIGRRTLKNRLINSDPERFGTTLPHTSRPMRELEEDGMGYWFVSREEMEHDIRDHQFLEHGEHNGHLYGTKLDSIRTVIRQGKMCVLDCSPNSLKILHNSPEFMPYVIFLAAPGMEQLKSLYEAASSRYSSRNLAGGTFERSSSIRFSSRRARTLESLVSLYEEEDFKNALEESARIQRTYEKYFDMVIVNEDPDHTFRKVIESLENLSNQHQWVPVSWVY